MKLQIPGIGDTLKLLEPWTFTVIPERRNTGIYKHFNPDADWATIIRRWQWRGLGGMYVGGQWVSSPEEARPPDQVVTFNPGVKLVVDRFYMAKHNDDFHSITFVVKKGCNVLGNKTQIRFFVSLTEANKIVCELVSTTGTSGLEVPEVPTPAVKRKVEI